MIRFSGNGADRQRRILRHNLYMNSSKPQLSQVSLVCVETRRTQLARYALERCMAAASFKECLLLCTSRQALPATIEQVLIPPFSDMEGYSSFMLKDIGDYFSGDFVLVVQWDGFILNADCWDDEFLQYDYIGAPWPHRPVAVGNGGFSLRSRRLIEALKKIDIQQVHPEDYVICELHREQLIKEHGIKFAPIELASKFAFEFIPPSGPTFGFHGFANFHAVFKDPQLAEYLARCEPAMLQNRAARNLFKNLCRTGRQATAQQLFKKNIRKTARGIYDALGFYCWMKWRQLSGRFD
ncbi:hypothetical protein LNV09_07705 [Paucibacter sp. B2R-40]|uniref:DUF5672 family protein n=1 Tax=Paucibacter sp. B2R-40 TaxID=2893554 RepID=UPI0021E4E34B|nr:DUF5672 family protein [Paucibacter sp. B2R-40]MCV2354049.1 hypothetical protein [Paucibacter sp. B2R-40]